MKENRLTRYLWRNQYKSDEEYEAAKQFYQKSGFRIVTYDPGPEGRDMTEFFRRLAENHFSDRAFPL